MSATQWSQPSYITDLTAAPQSYELLQALRLIYYEINKNKAPIEVRYRASLSLAYPLAEIESMTLIAQDSMNRVGDDIQVRQIEIYPTIIGLTGPLSALPSMYKPAGFTTCLCNMSLIIKKTVICSVYVRWHASPRSSLLLIVL